MYLIFAAGLVALGFFIDNRKEENKFAEINNGNYKVYGIVEKLKPHSPTGRRYGNWKDIVYLYYEKNDTIFHIIEDLSDGQIEKLEIKEYDSFLVRIAESDKGIFEIDFTKKLDTIIDKNEFENQVYNTTIHKYIIE